MLDKEHKVSIPGTDIGAGGGEEGGGGKEKDAYATTLHECE